MKRWLCLILCFTLAASLAGCGEKPQESTAGSTQGAPVTQPAPSTAAPETQPATQPTPSTAAPETAPATEPATEPETLPPPEPEALLTWGEKTLSGFGEDWAKRYFTATELGATEEEDADCASLRFAFAEGKEIPALAFSGSVFLGKDASILFDIPVDEDPEEGETQEAVDFHALMKESALQLLKEAGEVKEETAESGGKTWEVRSVWQKEEGLAVYDLIAWSEAEDQLVYVNVSAVLRGSFDAEKDTAKAEGLVEEWFSSLSVQ